MFGLKRIISLTLIALSILSFSTFLQSEEPPSSSIRSIEELVQAITSASSDFQREALLEKNKTLISKDLFMALTEKAKSLKDRGEFSESIAVATIGKKVAEIINDKPSISASLVAIGTVHDLRGEYQEAMLHLRKALTISEESGDRSGMANASNNIGNVYIDLGEYKLAIESYGKSLAICEAAGDKNGIARALNGLGNVVDSQGDHALAIDYFKRSLQIREEMDDKAGSAGPMNNLGTVYESLGDFDLAVEHYRKALSIYMELDERHKVAIVLNNLANAYKDMGNYALALKNHQEALHIRRKLGDKSGEAGSLINIGVVFEAQGNNDLALEYYQRSMQLARDLGENSVVGTNLRNIGNIYRTTGNYTEALNYIKQGLQVAELLGEKSNIASSQYRLGDLSLTERNFEKALEYFQKSFSLKEELSEKNGMAEALAAIGNVFLEQGKYELALENAEKAADLAQEISVPQAYKEARHVAGRAYLAIHKYEESRVALDDAIRTIEAGRTQLAGAEQASHQFLGIRIAPYHSMVELLLTQKKNEEALRYAERAKARVLFDVIQGGKVNITKAMTPGEKEEEQKLRNEMVSFNSQLQKEKLSEGPDKDQIAALENKLEKSRKSFEAFQTSLYALHPELKIQRAEFSPISISKMSELFDNPDTAFVEFLVAENQTYVFLLTKAEEVEFNVYVVDIKKKDLSDQVASFREKLEVRDYTFRAPAVRLYELLLKPAEEQLQGKTQLIIVPDGCLWELPFQALVGGNEEYLLERFVLSYTPSLTVLQEIRKIKNQSTNDALLAFGNAFVSEDTVKQNHLNLRDKKLKMLPESEFEVRMLQQLYGRSSSKTFVGKDALESKMKEIAGDFDILHLATHGILNDRSPMHSYLLLSTDLKDQQDGLLEAWEVMNLKLKSHLVVLSACETARGKIGDGEGVIGLAWAFFVAGTPTTVVSQWKVDSASTTKLMLEFHRNRKGGTSNAKSMRNAALKLGKSLDHRHPFYWAGFVVIGNGS